MSGKGRERHADASIISRRGLLTGGAALTGTLLLGGCNGPSRSPTVQKILSSAESLTQWTQRLLLPDNALAPEYSKADISPHFKANGTTNPNTPDYVALARNDFKDWRLKVGGLVDKPLSLSLDELRAMPSRTQITAHACVEGWTCIGEWTGVPLKHVLDMAGLKPNARYIVFYCADNWGDNSYYYESIGLIDAYHPQTILAYRMNGEPLSIPHGAPLRVRIERQLGYKMAKYIMRIEAVESFARINGGNGGYWEDYGYEWYAGI